MANARWYHTAILMNNGTVLVTGGNGNRVNPMGAEVYDPTTDTWSPTGKFSTVCAANTGTLLSSGKVLITSGYTGTDLTSADVYDPTANEWSAAGNLAITRDLFTITLLNNGKVLVAGGFSGDRPEASTEIYNPGVNASSSTGNMMVADGFALTPWLNRGQVR